MIRVSELSGAWLDYWVARAEGIPAAQLEVRQIQRSADFHCVQLVGSWVTALNYSSNWHLAGPIIERSQIGFGVPCVPGTQYQAFFYRDGEYVPGFAPVVSYGPTHLIAAMRCYAVSKFGEEVPEVK